MGVEPNDTVSQTVIQNRRIHLNVFGGRLPRPWLRIAVPRVDGWPSVHLMDEASPRVWDLRPRFSYLRRRDAFPEATGGPGEPLFTDPVGSDGAIVVRQIDSRFDGFRLAPHLCLLPQRSFGTPTRLALVVNLLGAMSQLFCRGSCHLVAIKSY